MTHKLIGSRAQVMHNNAEKTTGGLTKKDLNNKHGKIVSRKVSAIAKKNNRLFKAVISQKGIFGINMKGVLTRIIILKCPFTNELNIIQ